MVLALSVLLALPDVSPAQEQPGQEMTPEEQEELEAGKELGYGITSVLASALYSPLKITYAGLGLITGGLGFVLSGGRRDVADDIIYPAIQGHYVITPSHLKGIEPVIFIGPPPTHDSQPDAAVPPEPPSGR